MARRSSSTLAVFGAVLGLVFAASYGIGRAVPDRTGPEPPATTTVHHGSHSS